MSLRESYQQHKKLYLIGAAVLIVVIVGWAYARSRSNDPKFTTAEVRTGNITASVQATGTINALTTVPVGSYVSGTVEYIFADYNTRVHSGQVLAQLDPAIYEAQVTQARGNLENAQANLVTLAANVQVDQANLAKVRSERQVRASYREAFAGSLSVWHRLGRFERSDAIDVWARRKPTWHLLRRTSIQAKAQLNQARSQVTSMDGALKRRRDQPEVHDDHFADRRHGRRAQHRRRPVRRRNVAGASSVHRGAGSDPHAGVRRDGRIGHGQHQGRYAGHVSSRRLSDRALPRPRRAPCA